MSQTPDETFAHRGLPAAPTSAPLGQGMVHAPPAHALLGRPAYGIGKVRSTGTCFLLLVVTLGFYSLFWYHGTHSEMQRHRGSGVGGGVALLLGFFLPFVMLFITPSEVGSLYTARGQRSPVSAATGCWILLPFVGAIVWFVKTNGALNEYWRSVGAS
ncbi:DUF4234 domain-containing protein [Knoellia locipacati]|uniref:DUF4234 domain-containing protein n=1 Tax=Knoellia locipacati TaxID=882824 RepID=UPI00384AC80F